SPLSGAGDSPSFQWKRNGLDIPGATSSTYQSSSLANGDVIRVAMISSLSCAKPQTVLSHDSATMILSSVALTPMVTISSSAGTICEGETVTFTALPTNGGDVPGYQWKLNGINVGDNNEMYSCDSLHDGDIVTVEMFTSVPCATTPSTTSEPVTVTVTQLSIYYADFDGDGYGNGASGVAEACVAPAGYVAGNGDCDDNNNAVHPGSAEVCGNGIDDDCDGQTDEACGSPDNDSDGYTTVQGDCNDSNATIHPGATEICGNSIDDDCDGQVDEGCVNPDNDGDGYTTAQGDCNDNSAAIHPGAAETCSNSIDDDCDGQVDEGCNASTPLPVLILRTYPVKEGDAGQTILNVEVNLDIPAPLPVSVQYSTINDDAMAGSDYVAINGVLVIPAGTLSGSIQVRIIGDLLRESNERFIINFTNPVNAVLNDDSYSRIMIIDNDKGKNDNNNNAARADQVPLKEEIFKIPTVTRRNQVWVISQIGNYENEVLIVNVQGRLVSRFVNYHNQTPLGNVSTGLYFYRIRIMENPGQYKYYSGRLLITE
ncbi:MAG TPA: MopE-related protein, partial [Chitinophagaceae bacterium]|nr:MopE-related protein [Chitinophagaceae bacterium]